MGARSAADPDWAFRAADDAVLDALASGARRESLLEYFGAAAHAELSALASKAAHTTPRGARVLILPGIMGSRLGRGSGTDVLWIDPTAIREAGLLSLALPHGRDLAPRGVLMFYYAKMLLTLRAHGCDAGCFAYDWRLGLEEVGASLAERIESDPRPAILVAHSMGGLVARLAMGLLPKRRVRRLLMLGTPNFGSFGAVQALRGTYPFVRKVARLDPRHSAEFLAEKVFCGLPGVLQLLPARRLLKNVDLYQRSGWPVGGAVPDFGLLARTQAARAGLARADARMAQILGFNRLTVTGVRRKGAGFEYRLGLGGDGSVPVALARLPGIATYFVDESHSRLAANDAAIAAVLDLIRRGRTRVLPRRWQAARTPQMLVDDAQLCAGDDCKIDWSSLDATGRAAMLAQLYD